MINRMCIYAEGISKQWRCVMAQQRRRHSAVPLHSSVNIFNKHSKRPKILWLPVGLYAFDIKFVHFFLFGSRLLVDWAKKVTQENSKNNLHVKLFALAFVSVKVRKCVLCVWLLLISLHQQYTSDDRNTQPSVFLVVLQISKIKLVRSTGYGYTVHTHTREKKKPFDCF